MTPEKIIEEIIDCLDSHLKGGRGYIGQEPYKGDFFKLFKEAYRNGYFEDSTSQRLTGDALRDILKERWLKEDGKNDERMKLMERLFTMWNEWRYAWDHYDR